MLRQNVQKVGLPVLYNCADKLKALTLYCVQNGFELLNVLFVGNDINDLDCIKYVGLGIAVNDAFSQVKENADLVTKRSGGEGAVREVIDNILLA